MRIILLFLLAFTLTTCGKDIPPPTYLRIDQFTLEQNIDVNMGELTHSFDDVWLYVDNQNFGVFPVPCLIPLNLEGEHKITLQAGIRANGASGAKRRYPFVEHHIEIVNFTRLDTVVIQPKTKYYSTTQVWYEDFEDAAIQLISTNQSTVNMVKSNDPTILESRNGSFFGYVELNANQMIWDITTNSNWTFNLTQPIYLEIDYYSKTNAIRTGLRSQGNSVQNLPHSFIDPNRKENLEWRKMYIELNSVIAKVGSAGNTFNLLLNSLNPHPDSTTFVAIDNIKLVYR